MQLGPWLIVAGAARGGKQRAWRWEPCKRQQLGPSIGLSPPSLTALADGAFSLLSKHSNEAGEEPKVGPLQLLDITGPSVGEHTLGHAPDLLLCFYIVSVKIVVVNYRRMLAQRTATPCTAGARGTSQLNVVLPSKATSVRMARAFRPFREAMQAKGQNVVVRAKPAQQQEAATPAAPADRTKGRMTYRPASFGEMVSDAILCVKDALKDGITRLEVEFPPVPTQLDGGWGEWTMGHGKIHGTVLCCARVHVAKDTCLFAVPIFRCSHPSLLQSCRIQGILGCLH